MLIAEIFNKSFHTPPLQKPYYSFNYTTDFCKCNIFIQPTIRPNSVLSTVWALIYVQITAYFLFVNNGNLSFVILVEAVAVQKVVCFLNDNRRESNYRNNVRQSHKSVEYIR